MFYQSLTPGKKSYVFLLDYGTLSPTLFEKYNSAVHGIENLDLDIMSSDLDPEPNAITIKPAGIKNGSTDSNDMSYTLQFGVLNEGKFKPVGKSISYPL